AGFQKRVQDKRADSRDYYGLAFAYEHLNDNKSAVSYANIALKRAEVDRRMSEKDVIDCERIAKLQTKEEAPAKDEQAELFELLRQGKYQEAIAGFYKRVQEKRADSRDYYGLAFAYLELKDPRLAAQFAKQALDYYQNDHRLSTEELNAARRIAQRYGQ
ncbi:MAG TPA: hypothetical protein DC047_18235, partial [Blastocatellia bacterium]|nr:hypothetical protein [Blastocatellia bacterium]